MNEKTYPYPAGESTIKWISTEWLATHLHDTNLQIIDTQPNVHDYIMEHIPNALYLNEGLFRTTHHNQPALYIPRESIQTLFGYTGIDPQKTAVVYTGTGPFKNWGDGLEQTMVAYSLARFGHPHIYVLDGGIDKWKQENRPLTKEFQKTQPTSFTATTKKEFFIEYSEFKQVKDDPDVILLDARPANVYEGQGPWIKPGHIPGALNLPWASLMDATNKRLLKPENELQQILQEKNITKDKTIICSCGTGREATNEFILFKWYLQYPKVKIYEGSFTEWSSYPENPVATGKKPREIELKT